MFCGTCNNLMSSFSQAKRGSFIAKKLTEYASNIKGTIRYTSVPRFHLPRPSECGNIKKDLQVCQTNALTTVLRRSEMRIGSGQCSDICQTNALTTVLRRSEMRIGSGQCSDSL
eukprot:sb/3476843/